MKEYYIDKIANLQKEIEETKKEAKNIDYLEHIWNELVNILKNKSLGIYKEKDGIGNYSKTFYDENMNLYFELSLGKRHIVRHYAK